MSKRTVLVLGAPLGRVGSSALMGLLKLSGVNIGGLQSGLGKASVSNPKGHFEPPTIKDFLAKVFNGYFPQLNKTPTIRQLRSVGKKHAKQFESLITAEFGNTYPIALKGGRLLVLPFFEFLSNYDVKVLMLRRPPKDQLDSIIRVWNRSPRLRKNANIKHLSPILNKWQSFVDTVQTTYTMFTYLDIQFENLIYRPVMEMDRIAKFASIKKPAKRDILNWVDQRLVHNKK